MKKIRVLHVAQAAGGVDHYIRMDGTVRVAQIMGKLMAGGVEMVVFNYYRAIDKTKIQFDFYYDEDSTAEPPQDLIDMGARFIKIPPYQNLLLYLKSLERHFKENNYKIVHSHINTLSVFPLYVAWKCGVPVRIAHNHSVPGGENFKRTFLKYFLRGFSKVFSTDYYACSEKAGRWMFGNKSYDDGKVIVIKNAVDFEKFKIDTDIVETLKEQLHLDGKFVIGHVGRFTFAKNHKFLLKVFRQISDIRDDAALLLIGDGEMHDQIHEWVNEYGLYQKVFFTGQVHDTEKYYPLIDVMAIPSVFEGLSLVTIESQIAGIPVVVSEAIPEEAIISNGVRRLNLDILNWKNVILDYAEKSVELNAGSKEYNIRYAVKKLENLYEKDISESVL